VIKIQSFFANLVMDGIISEAEAVGTLGYRADKMWAAMEPFIVGERKLHGYVFANYFEDFVYRAYRSFSSGRIGRAAARVLAVICARTGARTSTPRSFTVQEHNSLQPCTPPPPG
jgi:hypothetical protein